MNEVEYQQNRKRIRTLEITVIAKCPVDCKAYCPQDLLGLNYHGQTLLKLTDFKKALQSVPKDVRIMFSGMGEPLLNPACKEMIQYAHDQGYEVDIYTTLANVRWEQWVAIHANVQRCVIHLPDKEGITIVKITPDFLKVVESLQDDPNVVFMSMADIIPEVRAMMPDYQCTFTNNGRAGNVKGTHPKKKTGPIFCFKLTHSQFVMLPDATVVLCCMDYSLRHRLGNLLVDEYEDLMRSQEMKHVLHSAQSLFDDYALCRTCTYGRSIGELASEQLIQIQYNGRVAARHMLNAVGLLNLVRNLKER